MTKLLNGLCTCTHVFEEEGYSGKLTRGGVHARKGLCSLEEKSPLTKSHTAVRFTEYNNCTGKSIGGINPVISVTHTAMIEVPCLNAHVMLFFGPASTANVEKVT